MALEVVNMDNYDTISSFQHLSFLVFNMFFIEIKLFLKDSAIVGVCVNEIGVQCGKYGDDRFSDFVASDGLIIIGAVDGKGNVIFSGIVTNFFGGKIQHRADDVSVAFRDGCQPFDTGATAEVEQSGFQSIVGLMCRYQEVIIIHNI